MDILKRIFNTADHDKYHAPDSRNNKTADDKSRDADMFAGQGSLADKLRQERIAIENGKYDPQ